MRISDWSSDVCSSDLVIVRLTYPEAMVERARKDAAKAGEKRAGMRGDPAEGLPRRWREKLRSGEAWRRVGVTYRSAWGMGWKRAEERRGGNEWFSTCRSRWRPDHKNINNKTEK